MYNISRYLYTFLLTDRNAMKSMNDILSIIVFHNSYGSSLIEAMIYLCLYLYSKQRQF